MPPTPFVRWLFDNHEPELELIQPQITQKPMLRGEVGARTLRNPEGRGKGRRVVHTSEHASAWWW